MVSGAAKAIATWLVTTPEGRATLVKAADMAQETARHRKAQAQKPAKGRKRRGGSGVKKGTRTKPKKR